MYKEFSPKHNEEDAIVRIGYAIIQQAIRSSASEFTIQRTESDLYTRIYAGGEWRDLMSMPGYVHKPLLARFKVMADMDPDRTESQSGIIRIHYEDKDYRLLTSTTPGEFGENITARIEY